MRSGFNAKCDGKDEDVACPRTSSTGKRKDKEVAFAGDHDG